MDWLIPVYELAMLIVPVYAFIVLRRRVKRMTMEKTRAFWLYVGYVIAPVLLFGLFFLTLVGVEEITGYAIIGEGLARGFLILVALGVSIWLLAIAIFGMNLLLARNKSR